MTTCSGTVGNKLYLVLFFPTAQYPGLGAAVPEPGAFAAAELSLPAAVSAGVAAPALFLIWLVPGWPLPRRF